MSTFSSSDRLDIRQGLPGHKTSDCANDSNTELLSAEQELHNLDMLGTMSKAATNKWQDVCMASPRGSPSDPCKSHRP